MSRRTGMWKRGSTVQGPIRFLSGRNGMKSPLSFDLRFQIMHTKKGLQLCRISSRGQEWIWFSLSKEYVHARAGRTHRGDHAGWSRGNLLNNLENCLKICRRVPDENCFLIHTPGYRSTFICLCSERTRTAREMVMPVFDRLARDQPSSRSH